MEEIEKRLRDATDQCLACHAAWVKNKKDGSTREKLQEAVHELRKVAARLEIEIAMSERDEMSAKPIPIPPHRASKRRPGEMNDFGGDDDQNGNMSGGSENLQDGGQGRAMRRRRPGGPMPGGNDSQPRESQIREGQPREGRRDGNQPRETREPREPRENGGQTLSTSGTLSAGGTPRGE